MKITAKTNEDVSYRGEPIRKMERALDRAMKKAGYKYLRTTGIGDHQYKKDGKVYAYRVSGQSGDPQYFDSVTITKGEPGWDKNFEVKTFSSIDKAMDWLNTKTSEKRIAKKYGAKNEGPGAGYFIKLKNVHVDKAWVESSRQYSILKAKFSADWEANHSYWGGEGSADDFEVSIYLNRSLSEFMDWPGAEEEYAQKGSLFDFVKDTCLDDIKSMLNFDCGREGYTYGGGWTTKIPDDGVFEFDGMQFDPDYCTVYQYHDNSYVPVSITSDDMMYGIQDAWDEWSNPPEKWVVEYGTDDGDSTKEYFDNEDDAKAFYDDHYGTDGIAWLEEPKKVEESKSEASQQMAINAYADKRFYDPEEFVKYVRKVAGKDGTYLSVDSVVSVDILDKANRLAQKDGFKKSEKAPHAVWKVKFDSKADAEKEADELHSIHKSIQPYVRGDSIFVKDSARTGEIMKRRYSILANLYSMDDAEYNDIFKKAKKSEGVPDIEELRDQTISWGTMRSEDLIPKFLNVLKTYGKDKYDAYVKENPEVLDLKGLDDETLGFITDELFDLLDEIAPEGTYFGAHPDDGADYGFWSVEESKQSESKKSERSTTNIETYDGINELLEYADSVYKFERIVDVISKYYNIVEDDIFDEDQTMGDPEFTIKEEGGDERSGYYCKNIFYVHMPSKEAAEELARALGGELNESKKDGGSIRDTKCVRCGGSPAMYKLDGCSGNFCLSCAKELHWECPKELKDKKTAGKKESMERCDSCGAVMTEYDYDRYGGLCKHCRDKDEAKKSESLTLKQAELKKMAKYGEAEDITSLSDAEAKELKKSGVELVGISRGIYGMNGALMRGTADGKLYVITSRNSNLFYFV